MASALVSNEVTTGDLNHQVFSLNPSIEEVIQYENELNSRAHIGLNNHFYSFLDEQAETIESTIVALTSPDPAVVVPTESYSLMEANHTVSSGRSPPTRFSPTSMPGSSHGQPDYGHLFFPVSTSGNSNTTGNSLLSCPSASCNNTFSTNRALKY